ncbi:hypothetical protein HGB07_06530 [Candidatus Roizmanbacteria bacterium]|nr:hypothetical protein [Candidatus Roizmanbacteria bacterium]
MHILQKELIKRLISSNGQSYAPLTKGYTFEENIAFHLKQLKKGGYVRKRDGAYFATKKALERSSEFDSETLKEDRYKAAYISFLCRCGEHYLLRKQPTPDGYFYKLPGAKPWFGEEIEKAVERIFKIQSGIELPFSRFLFTALHMKRQLSTANEVIFDNAMIVYEVIVDEKEKKSMKLKQTNAWVSESDLGVLPNVWPEVMIHTINKDKAPFHSYSLISNYVLHEKEV